MRDKYQRISFLCFVSCKKDEGILLILIMQNFCCFYHMRKKYIHKLRGFIYNNTFVRLHIYAYISNIFSLFHLPQTGITDRFAKSCELSCQREGSISLPMLCRVCAMVRNKFALSSDSLLPFAQIARTTTGTPINQDNCVSRSCDGG